MKKLILRTILLLVLVISLTTGVLSIAYAASNSNIDPDAKWAWSAYGGWINFNPPNGGVMVYKDHLEGYAWGENVGWIRLGSNGTSSTAKYYANETAENYGVNRDIQGNLSGYAWGTNIGWIDFSPEGYEGVRIDPISGDFSGYAWNENIGWIHFNGSGPVGYKVSILLYNLYLSLIIK